jgi:hypothetical protein
MKWSEITLPNEWLIENVSQPAKVSQDDTNVDYIQQYILLNIYTKDVKFTIKYIRSHVNFTNLITNLQNKYIKK